MYIVLGRYTQVAGKSTCLGKYLGRYCTYANTYLLLSSTRAPSFAGTAAVASGVGKYLAL